jgi:predicted DCC family thiol-disulfide oxidoreductase YuxK
MNNIFFYDGDCSFCSSLAKNLEKLCLNKTISFQSFRDLKLEELSNLHPELTFDRLESEVQFLYKGKRFPGFFAVRALAPNLKFWRYFFPLLYLPFVPFLGMGVMYLLRREKKLAS